jgi:penicillin-binding protein 1C
MKNRISNSSHRIYRLIRNPKLIAWTVVLFLFFFGFYKLLPSPLFSNPTVFVLTDEHDELLGAQIAADGQWRFPEVDQLPTKFEACLLAFEDRRFYYHLGVDPIAILRAIVKNSSGQKVVSGGSTLSMQVIRMHRQGPRTYTEKLIEALLAFRLECQYSKKKILQLYASHAPYGGNVVGIQAASWRYFGRPADELTWAEAATLAVLPNAPSLLHPGRNTQQLLDKRNRLLQYLYQKKKISKEEVELALLEPLPASPLPLPEWAPHLLARFKKSHQSGPTSLKTTLDKSLQILTSDVLYRHQSRLQAMGIDNAAAIIVEVETGATKAYFGNYYQDIATDAGKFVDIIPALRSPGSTLKPILYAAMLHEGALLPHSIIPDIPTQIGNYAPQNFDLSYDGAVPASQSLSRSLNIPAVKMLQQYKYAKFYNLLKQIGISTLTKPADHYGLSMILGGVEVSMWELTSVYASMARTLKHFNEQQSGYLKGDFKPLHYAFNPNSLSSEPQPIAPLDHASIYLTFNAMNEVARPGEEGLWEQFSSSRKIAWKTGTSFGFRDGWAIGITPSHVVCVWVGNADGEGKAGLTGIQTAAPILFDLFRLLPEEPWFNPPTSEMIQMQVCKQSGYLAGPDCTHPVEQYLPSAGHRSTVCPYHQKIHMNETGTLRVNLQCYTPSLIQSSSWFILPPAMAYYYRLRHADYKDLPPFATGCQIDQTKSIEFIYPQNHAKIYIPLEIDGQRGEFIARAAHQQARARIYWHLDDQYMGETTSIHQMAFQLAPGNYKLTLIDDWGQQISQYITILEQTK